MQIFVGCVLIYVSVYWRDIIGGSYSGSPSLILLLIGTTILLFSPALKLSNLQVFSCIGVLGLMFLNTAISGSTSFSNYLIAPTIALVIFKTARSTFLTILICHAIISVMLQVYEQITGSYIFAIEEDGLSLDASYFGGNVGIMRAKGLFQGPLSAVAFYILVSLIQPKIPIITIGVLGAFLAYGRLGIIITLMLFLFRLFAAVNPTAKFTVIVMALTILPLAPELISLPEFFASAFDISSPNNAARIYFWLENLSHYSNYPIINLAFGDLGYANRVIGSTENDFIRILMDTGILGFLFYLVSLYLMLRRAVVIHWEKVLHIFILAITMFAFPLIQSLNATILFWIYAWSFFHQHGADQNHFKYTRQGNT